MILFSWPFYNFAMPCFYREYRMCSCIPPSFIFLTPKTNQDSYRIMIRITWQVQNQMIQTFFYYIMKIGEIGSQPLLLHICISHMYIQFTICKSLSKQHFAQIVLSSFSISCPKIVAIQAISFQVCANLKLNSKSQFENS